MKRIGLVVVLCLTVARPLTFGAVGVDALSGGTGLSGGGVTLGYEFEVTGNEGITVDGLGLWDEQSNGFFLGQTFQVGLWDSSDKTLLRSTVISSSSPLTPSAHPEGDWRINAVAPIHLEPGLYRIGALMPEVGANAFIHNNATLQLAPGINVIRYVRHIGTTLAMPDIGPPYSGAMYVGATFTFTAGAAVTSNLFTFSSSPSSWIGQGQTLSFTNVSANRTFDLGAYTDSVELSAGGYNLRFVGPNLSLPQVGYYPGATRWPFMGSGTGMSFSGPGRGNNMLTGWFHVLEAEYDSSGQVAAFAVDFVQYDETHVTWWNRGSIRYNSTVPVPGPQPPMRIEQLQRTNQVVQFTLAGPAEMQCRIETSSDLVAWAPINTNTISPVGLVAISDPTSSGAMGRFYRAVSSEGGSSGGANDQFANGTQIPSAGGTVTGSNTEATKESGEPNHGGVQGGKSVWWTWTAPASGMVSVSLDGSSFDTTLGIYQGSTVTTLSSVGQDDDSGAGSRSRIIFAALGGVTYQIAVDGFGGASGTIRLTVKQGLLNDNFSERLQLMGKLDFVTGSNVGATDEAGEPFHWQTTGQKSVWWEWQAPATGFVTIQTLASTFDTLLAAYTGNSLLNLSLVANNDDYGGRVTSQIIFYATVGTVYQIAVDGYELESGTIRLQLEQQ